MLLGLIKTEIDIFMDSIGLTGITPKMRPFPCFKRDDRHRVDASRAVALQTDQDMDTFSVRIQSAPHPL